MAFGVALNGQWQTCRENLRSGGLCTLIETHQRSRNSVCYIRGRLTHLVLVVAGEGGWEGSVGEWTQTEVIREEKAAVSTFWTQPVSILKRGKILPSTCFWDRGVPDMAVLINSTHSLEIFCAPQKYHFRGVVDDPTTVLKLKLFWGTFCTIFLTGRVLRTVTFITRV